MYPESESYSPTTLYIVPSKIMRAVSPSPDLCICQIYILFLWHWPKNVLLCPSCFSLPQRKSCTIWCGGKKKVSFMEREGGAFPLWSKSADLLYLRKKNETTLLEADVDTVSVIEDGKSSLRRCSYKAVLMAVKVPVMRHLPSWRGQQKQYETQNEVSLWFQRTRNTKD